MIFIQQHATWRCVASSGTAGAASHSVTEHHCGRTSRSKHPFFHVLFVNIDARIVLRTRLLGDFPTNFMAHGTTQQQSSLPIKTQRRSIARTYVHAPKVITTPAVAALFNARIRYLPEAKTTATPRTIHIPLLPAEAPGLASCILFSVIAIQERKKNRFETTFAAPQNRIQNANLMHLRPPISAHFAIPWH